MHLRNIRLVGILYQFANISKRIINEFWLGGNFYFILLKHLHTDPLYKINNCRCFIYLSFVELFINGCDVEKDADLRTHILGSKMANVMFETVPPFPIEWMPSFSFLFRSKSCNNALVLDELRTFWWSNSSTYIRYPFISSSSGVVHATSRLSEPTRLVTRKFDGVINVGQTPAEFKSGYFFSLFEPLPI